MLKTCGSVVASSCGPSGQEGTATFSWSISPHPTAKKKHHAKKHHTKSHGHGKKGHKKKGHGQPGHKKKAHKK